MKATQQLKLFTVVAITSVVAALFVVLIVVIHSEEKKRIAAESSALLESITHSRQLLLSDWFIDEIHDVSLISKNTNLVELTNRFVEGKSDESILIDALNQIKSEHDYADLVFLNEAGDYQVSTNPALTFNDSIDKDILAMALKTDSSYVSDIYRSSIDNKIYVDLVTVIRNAFGKPLGGIIFKIYSERTIDKFLIDWHMTGYRGLVSLIQQLPDKQWHVYKPDRVLGSNRSSWNPLPERFRNNPFNSHYPLVQVVNMPNSPWYLMVELDDSKRKADANASVILLSIVGVVSVLLFFVGLLLIAFFQEKKFTIKLREKENELEQTMNQFQFSMDMLGEAVVLTDDQGRIQYMNLAAELLSGWRLEDVKGKVLEEQIPLMQEESGLSLLNVRNWFSGESAYNQFVAAYLMNKAGSRIRVVCSLAPLKGVKSDRKGLVLVLIKDNRKQNTPDPSDSIEIEFPVKDG